MAVWKPRMLSRSSKSEKVRRALNGEIQKHNNPKWVKLDIEWILIIPKIINKNGCWIPTNLAIQHDGYVNISIEGLACRLHRVILCVYLNLNYYDKLWVSRHSKDCVRACFNPEHLKPGTDSDNCKDQVEHGTHRMIQKKNMKKNAL